MHQSNIFDNLMFFMGVVEKSNVLPPVPGQVKVRVHGIHPGKEKVKTENLPWATPVIGTYNNAFKPPEENTWVFGVFLDGREAQTPLLLGSLPSIIGSLPDAKNKKGFGTSTGETKIDDLGDPSMAPEATADRLGKSSVVAKNAIGGQKIKSIGNAEFITSTSAYAAEYPYNYVHRTSSGHVIELDDTPNRERVHIFHRTGTSIEIDAEGNMSIMVVGEQNENLIRSRKTSIGGNETKTVNGNSQIKINRDLSIEIDGDANIFSHGDIKLRSAGKIDLDAGDSISMKAPSIKIESTTEHISLSSKDDIRLTADKNISQFASDAITSESKTNDIKSSSSVHIDGSHIFLQSGKSASSAKSLKPKTVPSVPLKKRITNKTPIVEYSGGGYGPDNEGSNE